MRAIVLGNQRLLVNIDECLAVRDVFFKRVGQENHVLGQHPHRVGVLVDGTCSWLSEKTWTITITSEEGALATTSIARNDKLDLTLTVHDIVLEDITVLVRTFTSSRPVRVVVYHYFQLYGDGIGDTAAYLPDRNILFHYKRRRYFLAAALRGEESVLTDYTVGSPTPDGGGSWRDAEDGVLAKNAIAQGTVDSCVAFDIGDERTQYVLLAARSLPEMLDSFDALRRTNRDAFVNETIERHKAFTCEPAGFERLPADWRRLYRTSLLLVRAHTDAGGAITAANDSDNMLFNRDTYSYVWGRDAALVCYAMDCAGKHDLTRTAYSFLETCTEPEGYVLHKHHPDGSLGSSWQAWVRDGKPYLPVQEDSTALVLFALKQYHERAGNDFIHSKREWITSMTDFLLSFTRDDIALPGDCWDLWEERQGIHTWTVASVIAGLGAAAFFARHFEDDERVEMCTRLADSFTHSLRSYLGSKEYLRFARRLTPTLEQDLTIDAADLAPFLFGVLPAHDPLVAGTAAAIEEHLKTPIGGVARYQKDYFHRKTEDAAGNAWIICTLWLARYKLATDDRAGADALIAWVVTTATVGGMLPEQVHPVTGEPYSVCPLTWSHAEFIKTVHAYIDATAHDHTKP
jgi:GH15 family glucan-1,4-alpha-glucosidase